MRQTELHLSSKGSTGIGRIVRAQGGLRHVREVNRAHILAALGSAWFPEAQIMLVLGVGRTAIWAHPQGVSGKAVSEVGLGRRAASGQTSAVRPGCGGASVRFGVLGTARRRQALDLGLAGRKPRSGSPPWQVSVGRRSAGC